MTSVLTSVAKATMAAKEQDPTGGAKRDNPIAQWEGSDTWVRQQFALYIKTFLYSVGTSPELAKLDATGSVPPVIANDSPLRWFGGEFCLAWLRTTTNAQRWMMECDAAALKEKPLPFTHAGLRNAITMRDVKSSVDAMTKDTLKAVDDARKRVGTMSMEDAQTLVYETAIKEYTQLQTIATQHVEVRLPAMLTRRSEPPADIARCALHAPCRCSRRQWRLGCPSLRSCSSKSAPSTRCPSSRRAR
jgi:hypothetical protein